MSHTDNVRLLGAVALAASGDSTKETLLESLLKWPPFEKMVKRESKKRS
jgi:hypothetical protein